MVLRSVYFMVEFRIFIPELWDFIHQMLHDFKAIFRMSCCKLRTPLPIHFNLRIVIGIDSLMVCILFGEISIFLSRVMVLYLSNCRRFFVCRAVNWEPLCQFISNFAQLLELIVLRSVYFLVRFRFFIPELWDLIYYSVLFQHKYCINVPVHVYGAAVGERGRNVKVQNWTHIILKNNVWHRIKTIY